MVEQSGYASYFSKASQTASAVDMENTERGALNREAVQVRIRFVSTPSIEGVIEVM